MATHKPIPRPLAVGLLLTPFIIVLVVVATIYQTQLTTKVATSNSVAGHFQVNSSSSVLKPGSNVVLSWGKTNTQGELVTPGLLDRVFTKEKIELVIVNIAAKTSKRFTLANRVSNNGSYTVKIPTAINSLLSKKGAKAFFELSAVDKNNNVTNIQTSTELVDVQPATKEQLASADTGTTSNSGSGGGGGSSGGGGNDSGTTSSNDSAVASTPDPVSATSTIIDTTPTPSPTFAPTPTPTLPAAPVASPTPTPDLSTLPDLMAVGLQGLGDFKVGVMNGYDAKVANYNPSGGATVYTTTTAGAWLDLDGDGIYETNLDTAANTGFTPGLEQRHVADILWASAGRGILGTHHLKVCADIYNQVKEANEDNNCAVMTFTVKP